MPFINEAVRALADGVAAAEAIDTVAKLGFGHPIGPLALADLIGLDTLRRDHGGARARARRPEVRARIRSCASTSPPAGSAASRATASSPTADRAILVGRSSALGSVGKCLQSTISETCSSGSCGRSSARSRACATAPTPRTSTASASPRAERRALIRASRPLVRDQLAALDRELRWLGGVTGPVRDLDVLIEHLRELDAVARPRPGGRRGDRRRARARAAPAARRPAHRDRRRSATASCSAASPSVVPSLHAADGSVVARAARPEGARAAARRRTTSSTTTRATTTSTRSGSAPSTPATRPSSPRPPRDGAFERARRRAGEVQDLIGAHQDAVVAEQRVRALATDDVAARGRPDRRARAPAAPRGPRRASRRDARASSAGPTERVPRLLRRRRPSSSAAPSRTPPRTTRSGHVQPLLERAEDDRAGGERPDALEVDAVELGDLARPGCGRGSRRPRRARRRRARCPRSSGAPGRCRRRRAPSRAAGGRKPSSSAVDLVAGAADGGVARRVVVEQPAREPHRADVDRAHPGEPVAARADGDLGRAAADVADGDEPACGPARRRRARRGSASRPSSCAESSRTGAPARPPRAAR